MYDPYATRDRGERSAIMKSVREIYNEICNSEELQAGLKAAQNDSTVGDYLIGLGCSNVNEIMLDFYRKSNRSQSLSLDDLDSVVGGTGRNSLAGSDSGKNADIDKLSDAELLNMLFEKVL